MRSFIRIMLVTSLAAVLLVSIGGYSWMRINHAQLLSVQTGSMIPTFRPGDTLLVRRTSTVDLKPGMIISYRSVQNPRVLISHRIVNIDPFTRQITTKGDDLPQPDPLVIPVAVAGQAVALFPRLGSALEMLKRPLGLALAVYLPACVILWREVSRLSRQSRIPAYQLPGYRMSRPT